MVKRVEEEKEKFFPFHYFCPPHIVFHCSVRHACGEVFQRTSSPLPTPTPTRKCYRPCVSGPRSPPTSRARVQWSAAARGVPTNRCLPDIRLGRPRHIPPSSSAPSRWHVRAATCCHLLPRHRSCQALPPPVLLQWARCRRVMRAPCRGSRRRRAPSAAADRVAALLRPMTSSPTRPPLHLPSRSPMPLSAPRW